MPVDDIFETERKRKEWEEERRDQMIINRGTPHSFPLGLAEITENRIYYGAAYRQRQREEGRKIAELMKDNPLFKKY